MGHKICKNCGAVIPYDQEYCDELCQTEYSIKRNTNYECFKSDYVHICNNCGKKVVLKGMRLGQFKFRMLNSPRSNPNTFFCSRECLNEFSSKYSERKKKKVKV